jgi:periplasmic iron binding protein
VIVLERWRGLIVVALILGGVVLVLALNLNLSGPSPALPLGDRSAPAASAPTAAGPRPPGFREYPIGEEVEQNQMRVAAVWLPPVQMDGAGSASQVPSAMIHLEADIHATEGNRNGFAKDEFVPYLTVEYAIVPTKAGPGPASEEPLRGIMMPMVARDGWHYGVSLEMPKAGRYKLNYKIQPPSAGGLAGRHSDPVTGVDPWWKPFEVTFDWDYPGPPT